MFNESNLSLGEDEPNHQEVDISQIPIWDIKAIEKLPEIFALTLDSFHSFLPKEKLQSEY